MKKGILCILLSIVMLVPMLTSCTQEADLTGEEASIYTLYTIVDEKTTPEAIRQVELALNRILFYRLNVILKLVMVPEAEYDKLIEDKFAEMEAYQDIKLEQELEEVSNDSEGTTSKDVLTGDKILDLLEDGKDIPLDEPRLDIFLVRGYDQYYDLATNNKLSGLDEKLSNEAKALKSSIHSTFFNAALVNGKTYGVPVNKAIGEYTYLVFDSELLEKYSVDPNTIKSLEDLEDYLAMIKNGEENVVPLKSTKESAEIQFLVENGFPAIVDDKGYVNNAYSGSTSSIYLKNYFSMIARYQANGYLGNESVSDEEDTNRYAVRIETGSIDEINNRLNAEDDEYQFSLYSNPVATNENTIDNIFCVSEYVVSNELTDVMKIVAALNTDAELMNILTYGVENEHYKLDDNGQVERLNEDYIIAPEHAGNSFITYTLHGENPDKWNEAILQNQDAIPSPSLGFTMVPKTFTYEEDGQEVTINEPDYFGVLNTVIVDKYYPLFMNGTAVENIDYDALYEIAKEEITNEFIAELNTLYETNILKPQFSAEIREEITADKGPKLLADATDFVVSKYRGDVVKKLTKKLTDEYKAAYPDASDYEIEDMVYETLTDEYIDEHFNDYYPEKQVNEAINETYIGELDALINAAIEEMTTSSEYISRFNKLKESDAYVNELNAMLEFDAPDKITKRIDSYINLEIENVILLMFEEVEFEMQALIDEFVNEYAEKLGMTEDGVLISIGYLVEKSATEEEGDGSTDTDTSTDTETSEDAGDAGDAPDGGEGSDATFVPAYETWFEFVLQTKITNTYYQLFGNPADAA